MNAILDVLAAARLSRLIREDTIFDDLRYAFVTHRNTRRWAPEFVRCPWCVGVWSAFAVVLIRRRAPWLRDALAVSYAAAQVAVHFERDPTD